MNIFDTIITKHDIFGIQASKHISCFFQLSQVVTFFYANFQWEIVTVVLNYAPSYFGMDYSLANSLLEKNKHAWWLQLIYTQWGRSRKDIGYEFSRQQKYMEGFTKEQIAFDCYKLLSFFFSGHTWLFTKTRCNWIQLQAFCWVYTSMIISESCFVTLLWFAKYVPCTYSYT